MMFFGKKSRSQPVEVKKRKKTIRKINNRGFAASEEEHFLSDFKGTSLSIDAELTNGLRKMRMRSRTLAQDNDYARKYLAMVKANVVGANGIILQAKTKDARGKLDKADNDYIEKAFKDWGRFDNCTMNKRLSWCDVQNLFIETVARDGESLCVIHNGKDLEYGIALQMVDIDLLDESYNFRLDNGNQIRMGVEQDQFGAAVAYHLLTDHPGDDTYTHNHKKYIRITADRVIHAFRAERPSQSRGIPWMHTAIRRLNMLGGMEEAELVASRVAASKMGFYISPEGDGYVGDDEENGDGSALLSDCEPGVFEQLPEGTTFQTFDPQHPSTAFDSFVKTVLRGAASGLNVSYNTLANDLEGVSFSSIRSGTLEERDQWKQKQTWMIEQFCMPVYKAWLSSAILHGKLKLPATKIDKFSEVTFQSRGWAWVDPAKDIAANAASVELGVTTRSDIAASQGKNLEDIFEQLNKEKELAAQYGIILGEQNEQAQND